MPSPDERLSTRPGLLAARDAVARAAAAANVFLLAFRRFEEGDADKLTELRQNLIDRLTEAEAAFRPVADEIDAASNWNGSFRRWLAFARDVHSVAVLPEDANDDLIHRRSELADAMEPHKGPHQTAAKIIGQLTAEATSAMPPVTNATDARDRAGVDARAKVEDLALAILLAQHQAGRINVKRIAEETGVPRTTLVGWPRFKRTYDTLKAPRLVRHGSKRDGIIEAFDD